MEAVQRVGATGIGAPMRRVEDRRFVTGKGDFVDDLALPSMAFAYVVRSLACPRQNREHRQRCCLRGSGRLLRAHGPGRDCREHQRIAVPGLPRRTSRGTVLSSVTPCARSRNRASCGRRCRFDRCPELLTRRKTRPICSPLTMRYFLPRPSKMLLLTALPRSGRMRRAT